MIVRLVEKKVRSSQDMDFYVMLYLYNESQMLYFYLRENVHIFVYSNTW